MKITPVVPALDINGFPVIITIGRIVNVIDDNDDDEIIGDANQLEAGTYAIDSVGTVWIRHDAATKLFEAFDMDDPQLKKDRIAARERQKRKRRKKRESA